MFASVGSRSWKALMLGEQIAFVQFCHSEVADGHSSSLLSRRDVVRASQAVYAHLSSATLFRALNHWHGSVLSLVSAE